MGTFRAAIEIGDPTGTRWLEVEALADTGATYTSVPANILEELSVVRHVPALFVLADGREVQPGHRPRVGACRRALRGRRLVPVPALLLTA